MSMIELVVMVIMRNNKAFTLVELIATIVIISLIFLVAIPSVYKLMQDNDKKEYEYYYKIAKEAAYVYADSRIDSLGGSFGTGCIGGGSQAKISVSELIDKGYLKPFDKKNVDYSGNVVIRNDHGKVTVNLYMKFNDMEYGEQDDGVCVAYVPKSDNTLSDVIMEASINNKLNGTINGDQYIVGSDPNNYVWYSGKLWRIIKIDKDSQNIQLVTNDIISVIPYDFSNNNFKDSYIESWLNEYFLNSLRNSNKFVATNRWTFYSTSYVNNKVGLVSLTDVNTVGYLNTTQSYWTLTKSNGPYVASVNVSSGTANSHPSTYMGVRPSIYINSGIKVVGGSGSKTSPYRLDGDNDIDQKNKKLNTRYSGEYVKIDNSMYRIVSINDDITKLVSVNSIGNKMMENKIYTVSPIYEYLNNTWLETLSLKNRLSLGNWCLNQKTYTPDFSKCGDNNQDIKSFKVGLLKLGELFGSYIGTDNSSFWTLTPSSLDAKMVVVNSNGSIGDVDVTLLKGVKPSFYLNSATLIKSGTGTENNPFVL